MLTKVLNELIIQARDEQSISGQQVYKYKLKNPGFLVKRKTIVCCISSCLDLASAQLTMRL